jgi:genome maintenance exonuclease 1
MLIQNKYNYKPLSRIDSPSGRKYIVGESRPLPSVTAILGKTQDMTHLLEWRANVGIEEATRITTEASGIGTGMHSNLEKYILGNPMKGTVMAQALAKVIIKKGLCNVNEVWGTEVGLYSKELYAGTTDVVGVHLNKPAVIDFKNSLREKQKEHISGYLMQLCAYSLAHNEMFGTDIRKGVVMIATREGKYQEFIIEDDEYTHYETMWANTVCKYYEKYGME